MSLHQPPLPGQPSRKPRRPRRPRTAASACCTYCPARVYVRCAGEVQVHAGVARLDAAGWLHFRPTAGAWRPYAGTTNERRLDMAAVTEISWSAAGVLRVEWLHTLSEEDPHA